MTNEEISDAALILRQRIARDTRLITEPLLDLLGDIACWQLGDKRVRRDDLVKRIERELTT